MQVRQSRLRSMTMHGLMRKPQSKLWLKEFPECHSRTKPTRITAWFTIILNMTVKNMNRIRLSSGGRVTIPAATTT